VKHENGVCNGNDIMKVHAFVRVYIPSYTYYNNCQSVFLLMQASITMSIYFVCNRCWLSVENGLIWAFAGLVISIIVVRTYFRNIILVTKC
jgi:hypothetical protein